MKKLYANCRLFTKGLRYRRDAGLLAARDTPNHGRDAQYPQEQILPALPHC